MKKSTLLMVLSLVLALTVGLGTTLAYLTDTDADVNVMTLGNVDILQNEQERDENGELQEFSQNKPLYPAVYEGSSIQWAPEDEWVVPGEQAWKVVEDNENVVDKFVTVTNTGKSDAYVRTFFAFESTQDPATQGDYIHAVINADTNVGSDVMSKVIWLPGTYQIDGSYYQIGYVTYAQPVQPGETTIPSLKQIYMDKAADNDYVATFGDTYEILVLSQAVQTAGFDSAEEALNEAFPMDDDYANVPGWFTGWTEDDIGSPGDEWLNNNPPAEFTGDPAELAKLLTEASDAGSGNVTIELTESYDMTGFDWTPVNVDGYHGADIVTINGNGNYIKGLNAPLYGGGFAGGCGIEINDLTIMDSNIVSKNTIGSGAFIESCDSMNTIPWSIATLLIRPWSEAAAPELVVCLVGPLDITM